ncbi:MAG: DUF4386 family protein [Deinococcota bacterium]
MNITSKSTASNNTASNNTRQFQKFGGLAALVDALTFIIGFALYFSLLASANYGDLSIDPVQHAAFLTNNQSIMYAWNFIIYVVFGIALVVLSLALHDRLKDAASALSQVALAFGLIWSGLVIASGMVANVGANVVANIYAQNPDQAGSTWLSLQFVIDGLGGGNEIVGGVWLLLVSIAALQAANLPRFLNYFGIVISLAGILSMIPVLSELGGSIFGLGLIVWFVWVGIAMLRRNVATQQKSFAISHA